MLADSFQWGLRCPREDSGRDRGDADWRDKLQARVVRAGRRVSQSN